MNAGFRPRMPACDRIQCSRGLRMLRLHMICASMFTFLSMAWLPAAAADPKPEIQRGVGTPQAVGAVHTLRTIPEACARLEGQFTGDAAAPYKFAAVHTGTRCAPRAKLVDAGTAKVSATTGWILNDVIRVPSAACATQQAVVRAGPRACNRPR